ncbi:MAG: MFS transporter [Rhodospirillaceae bacterium]|nr:MFS transporter [Rhodospirillaceae bacterium]|tara:strand:+ start:155 stop:1339 length:1185 start_codon:yes stop_codon:yes gene_type:complete
MQDSTHNPKLTLIVASIAHSFSHMFMLLYATVVLVINIEFNLTYSELQWLSVPGFIMFGLAAFPAGWLGDRWSATGMLVIFFIGLGFSAILTGFANDRVTLLVGLTLIGTFGAIYHPVGIAWLVKHSVNRGRALGINGVFGNIGTASAAIVAGFLADFFGWRYAFFVPGILSLIFGFLLLFILSRGFLKDVSTDAVSNPVTSSKDIKRAFFALFITVIMVGLIFQSTSVGLPKIFSDRLDIGSGAFGPGALVALVYFLAAGAQLIGGEAADRYPQRRVYLYAQLFQIPIVLIAFITINYGLVLLAVLMVSLNMGAQPVENALVAKYTPTQWRSRMYGIKFVLTLGVTSVGVALVPVLSGIMGSLDLLFIAIALFAFIAFFGAWLLPRDKKSIVS